MQPVRIGGLWDGENKHQIGSVWDANFMCPTIDTMAGGCREPMILEQNNLPKIKIKQATKQGFIECDLNGCCCLDYPTSELRRGRVIDNGNISPTLTTENIPNVIELGDPKFYSFIYKFNDDWWLIRIRKLTPRECWRLMGFYDEDFEKAEMVCSNTQLYKQAGNSIVVNVLEAIFKAIIGENDEIHDSN